VAASKARYSTNVGSHFNMDKRVLLFLTLTSCTFETVELTERGIILDSKDDNSSYKELLQPGTYTIPFYDDFVKIEITPKDYNDEFNCLTKDEKTIRVEGFMQYYPIPDQVTELYKDYGYKFVDYLIIPEFRAAIRRAIMKYDSSHLDKSSIEAFAHQSLDSVLNKGHVATQDFKIDWVKY
jgi:regulator of protease activity HflC (stomatin/prohibitin superfamily)